jgi:hypothetical protein
MESQYPEQCHIVAHAKVRLYRKTEGGIASVHGRLMAPANFNDAEKNAWSSWFIFTKPTRIGTESLVPMAIVFEDEAPTDRLLTVGNTFTIFLDGKTSAMGEIVDVMTMPDNEFRATFRFDEWPGIHTVLLHDEPATER